MTRSHVFKTNHGQAVRIPKAVAFPDNVQYVDILRIGHNRVIVPEGKRWDDLFVNGPRITDDFVALRQQPTIDDRK